MASTTLPNLPATISLTGAELVWVNYVGVDFRTTTAEIAALSGGGGGGGGGLNTIYVVSSGIQTVVGGLYSVDTTLGAFSITLPPLISAARGKYLEIQDVGYNAGVNNVTINAFGGDGNAIQTFGATASSMTMNLNDAIIRFTRTTTGWRAVPWGY